MNQLAAPTLTPIVPPQQPNKDASNLHTKLPIILQKKNLYLFFSAEEKFQGEPATIHNPRIYRAYRRHTHE